VAQVAGSVERKGDDLVLRFKNGASKTLRGNPKACAAGDGENCLDYRLAEVRPEIGVIVVRWSVHEDGGALVYGLRSGRSVSLGSMPEFSPDGNAMASVVSSQGMAQSDYHVAIYGITGDGPRPEFQRATEDYPGEDWAFKGWDGPGKVRFEVTKDAGTGRKAHAADAMRTGKGWHLLVKP